MQPMDPDQAYLSTLCLLYVEDEPAGRLETSQFLRRRCGKLALARDGQEGLEQFAAEHPDLVVTDIRMPRMDGLEMAAALRRQGWTGPIIALTAFDGSEYLLRAIDEGVDRYVLKPVQPDKLDQALLHCARMLRERAALREAEARIRSLNEELEQRVLERTARLEAANRELAELTYAISHDLRTPLRAIDGFSLVVMEDYGDRLDEEGRRCLSRVRHGAQRMGQLLADLLRLSRTNRGDLDPQPLDLTAKAHDVIEDLIRMDPHRQVRVVIAPGLKAMGDRHLIKVLLENLLCNAWKYSAQNPEARIEFGVRDGQGEPVFFVQDNGVGFDMTYASRLFGAFQQLHSGQDYTGTGIGLAIAQRIVHRHGGLIWADAEPGRGATFSFTLPDPRP